ncbi:MAG TPA: immunoglobulin domain-containing protein [Allosphingosinicella sp.]|nr:immunoglobulin domain-containing protein [Allosphingosinicella sp.]
MLTLASCGGGGGGGGTSNPTVVATSAAPKVTVAPTSLSAAVGQAATFTVTATGDAPLSYQWRKNGTAISGATLSSFSISGVQTSDQGSYDVVISNSVGSVTSAAATLTVTTGGFSSVPVTYTSFNGPILELNAWEGSHTALLTARADLDPAVITRILKALDATYLYYQDATGFTPAPQSTYKLKLTVAEVPDTCGAGCGFLGLTGIELQTDTFAALYSQVQASDLYDQAVFYEFGRNFWSLSPQLEYKAPDRGDSVVTGFAVFMRFMAMDAIGVSGAPFNGQPFAQFRADEEQMVDLYAADPTQTFQNTLQVGRPQANNPSGLEATDLFASFLFRLRRDYGGNDFVSKLWHEAALRPAAATTQDAVDNFVVAASKAANRNLANLFINQWRWPVSAAAVAEISTLPAA